jgi:5-methylcytosine-specific restriction endonuclease McrA
MNTMKTCLKCGDSFPMSKQIKGTRRNFQNRKYCLKCSPWGAGNNKNLVRTAKVCPRCKEEKSLSEFYIKGRLHYAYCKPCMQNYNREFRTNIKIKAIQYKGGKCQNCGYCKNIAALEFHHVSADKEKTIAHWKVTFEKMKSELDKCKLLCSNCHREEHHPYYLLDAIEAYFEKKKAV